MGFMDAVKTCLNKYIDIKGRARRSELWWFFLFNVLVQVVATILDGILGMGGPQSIGLLAPIASLALLLPGITVGVRRLHDRDMSGWWMLIGFFPILGGIALLVIFVMKGTDGDNRFGPDPLA
jgi:uncharacterized membrane protein YhaH (DUF805 family)